MRKAIPKSFLSLFKEAFHLYRRHFLNFICILLTFFIPVFLLYYLVFSTYGYWQSMTPYFSTTIYPIITLLLLVCAVFFGLLNIAVLIYYIDAAYLGKSIEILGHYKLALKNLRVYVWVNVYYTLKVLLWSVCLLLPGIYFGTLYNYAPMIVLLEGKTAKEAIQESASLIKPYLVKYLDYIFLAGMIIVLCYVPLAVIFDVLTDLSYKKGWVWLIEGLDHLWIITLIFALQFIFVFHYLLYRTFKEALVSEQ